MLSLPQNCSEGVQATQSRIAQACRAASRSVDSVTLLAVSKGQSSAAIDCAARAGIENFGENFLQESLPKIEALTGRELTWHFIGRLQANKTRAGRREFRLGACRRPPQDRRAPVGAAPAPRPAAQCLPATARRWRSQQGRCRSGRHRAARDRGARPAAHQAARPHVHAARGNRRRAPARNGSGRPARCSTISTSAASVSTRCRWAPAPISKRRSRKAPPWCASERRSSARARRNLKFRCHYH